MNTKLSGMTASDRNLLLTQTLRGVLTLAEIEATHGSVVWKRAAILIRNVLELGPDHHADLPVMLQPQAD